MTRALGLLAVALPASLAAQGVAYEGALSVASGRYIFATPTTSWTLATGFSLSAGRLTVRAAVPLLAQSTTLLTGSGAGMMPSGGSSSGMVAESGGGGGMLGGGGMHRLPAPASALRYRVAPGDPLGQLTWRVTAGRVGLTLGAAAKAPLTDTSRFGTGAWDVGAAASVTVHMSGGAIVGLDAAFWHLGDLPTLDFRDPVLGTITVGRSLGPDWSILLSAGGGSSVLRGYDGPWTLGATLGRVAGSTMWALNATAGLTESVPDVAIGLAWRIPLRRSTPVSSPRL